MIISVLLPDCTQIYLSAPPLHGFSLKILIKFPFLCTATLNVFKYTQTHREIEVLADASYCFNVYALAIVNNTLLTSSNVGTTMYTPQS